MNIAIRTVSSFHTGAGLVGVVPSQLPRFTCAKGITLKASKDNTAAILVNDYRLEAGQQLKLAISDTASLWLSSSSDQAISWVGA